MLPSGGPVTVMVTIATRPGPPVERGRGARAAPCRRPRKTRKPAEKAMPKGRMTSLDIRAMITSLETSIIGYRITNIYDITPKTCARRERWPGHTQRATTQTLALSRRLMLRRSVLRDCAGTSSSSRSPTTRYSCSSSRAFASTRRATVWACQDSLRTVASPQLATERVPHATVIP